MKHQNDKEYLSGTIERITYHNADNGFCVIRVKVKGHKDLVTVTGNVPSISAGEYIKCSGIWHNDRNHGKQFKADFLKSLPPETLEGIERYLGSGLIKGIGAHFAKRLVSAFGDKVFEVIENKPDLLSTVEGIGKIRAQSICSNWQDQKIIREIMVFLQSHGVGTTRATRIYKTYGEKAIEVVSQNPYQLAKDIKGIGFVSADMIAGNLGIAKDSLVRARAGVAHVLLEATSDGHCGLPKGVLCRKVRIFSAWVSSPLVISHTEDELILK
jgi:exodeoxyribonuclease V alpha subunit